MGLFTIEELKKSMGPGLGLRKNKYLIEVPVPGIEGRKINILCRSTSLPERVISTIDVYDKGRRYKVRAETDFPGIYNISILDDSEMNIRRLFDAWMRLVDNTKPNTNGILGTLGNNISETAEAVAGIIGAANTLKNSFEVDEGLGFVLNAIDGNSGHANYQADVNIWQLDSKGNKVYGYKLQNAFPTTLGTVTLDDGEENTLSEFSVDFSYSEFIPLENKTDFAQVAEAAVGQNVTDIINGIGNL